MSAYENEHTFPELDTLQRIAAAADAELALAPRGSERVRQQYGRLAAAIDECDQAWALRLVAELVDWVRSGVVAVSSLEQDPGSTGDRRWDALVGGVVEMLATEADESVPAWASGPGRVLDEIWFYTTLTSLRPHVFVNTPAALAARGVYVSADSFVSV
jgi:hypothetical protein